MKPTLLPEFLEIATYTDKTDLKLHASQVHGIMAGIICGGFPQEEDWTEVVMGEELSDEVKPGLSLLFATTQTQLANFLFEFQMLLPDDDSPLQERAEALTVWCQGFLAGLQHAGIDVPSKEEGEMFEAINDIVEIAKMNYDLVVASEEDEVAYAELVEYVRMAVILIYQSLHADTESEPTQSDTLH